MRCASCDFENSPIARFCGGCGKPIEAVGAIAPDAERRHICVLFCDLVGSTPLSGQVDPEDLRIIVGSYQRVCEGVVRRNGGFVAQYRGDSLEVYFGYPTAHEDDASRAVRCGLEMVAAVRQLAVETKVDLDVRIGIHDGKVVVGAVEGPNRAERWAIGDTPNIAARIQAECSPGEVLLSDSLHRLLPATFALESIDFRRLKGVNRPFELFRAIAAHREVTEVAPTRTPFLGRDVETARIRQIWAHAQAGTPQFILLRGEPGIGKSRLVEVIRDQIADERTDVLVARCAPVATDTAFGPLVELMGKRLGLKDVPRQGQARHLAERMAELGLDPAEAVPLLGSILSLELDPALWPAPALSPARARQRTIDLLVDAVHALARGGQALLIFEDLHWSDPSSQELLQQLIASSRSAMLTALLTARPEFAPAWADAVNVERIELEGLGTEQAEQLIRKVAKNKPLPPSVVWEIRERGTGNPLFLEEITRAVIESGTLVERENWWEIVGAIQPAVVPTSIDASLMARIDRLGEARPLFQLAATIGREFSLELLTAVAEVTEDIVRQQLETILQSGLLLQHGYTSPVYSFKHALIQDAAYASLLRTTRKRYHDAIARALLSGFLADVEKQPEVVARHLSGAGRHVEASDYWSAAGQRAIQRMAIPEAHGHFLHALQDLKQLPETPDILARELDLQIAIAPTLMTVHGWASPSVAEACERARTLCHRLDRPDKLYPAVWGLWTNLFVGGRLDRAFATANEALAMAKASGVPMLEITARHAVAYSHYYRGEWAQAIAQTDAALPLYSAEQERILTSTFQISSTVNIVAARGSSFWMMGHQDQGIHELDRMIAIAREINHPSALSNALGVACYMLTFHRDPPRMLRCAEEVKSFAREEGWELWYAVGVMSSGWARLAMGGRADALQELFEGVTLFRATRSDLMGPTLGVIHGEGLWASGRQTEALEMLADAAETAERGHVGVLLPEVYRLMGEILLESHDPDGAEATFRKALKTATAQNALSFELRSALSYHTLLERTQRRAEGVVLVRNYYEQFTDSFAQPDLMRARALLDAASH